MENDNDLLKALCEVANEEAKEFYSKGIVLSIPHQHCFPIFNIVQSYAEVCFNMNCAEIRDLISESSDENNRLLKPLE